RAGLGLGGGASNLEANLAYLVRTSEPESRLLEAVWPEVSEPLDVDGGTLDWQPTGDADAEGVPVLPAAFQEALFDASNPNARWLLLRFGNELPAWWSIRDLNGRVLVDGGTWPGVPEHEVSWIGPPPFILQVHWQSEDGPATAAWPVNVLDPAKLPPP